MSRKTVRSKSDSSVKKVAEKKSNPKSNIKYFGSMLAVILIIGVFTLGFREAPSFANAGNLIASLGLSSDVSAGNSPGSYSGESVSAELFVMCQCPYGVMAENAMLPLKEKFGDALDLKIHFIVTDTGNGTFRSLHGQAEVDEDIRQVCAMEKSPSNVYKYILCRNKDIRSSDWEACAKESNIDAAEIKSCFESDEGKELLRENMKRSDEIGARSSPTIIIDGAKYMGGRDTDSFMKAICTAIPEHAECSNMPKPVEVKFTVLNDKRCDASQCDPAQVVSVTKQLFPGAKISYVDYNSAEGQDIYNTLGLKYLPAYIFDSAIENSTDSFEKVKSALVKAGSSWVILPEATGSSFDPKGEICGNGIDDNGDGASDCADVSCASKMECRAEKSATVDLFVMSQCPYGVAAEKNMKEVLDIFGKEISFNVHFIANDNNDGTFSSLHGQAEVDEDIRQVCVMKYYPAEYYNYTLCVDNNYRSAASVWSGCAKDALINESVISACFGSEGAALLRENIKLTNELNIGSSPTFLINNRYMFGGAQPASYLQTEICSRNPSLSGCKSAVSGNAVEQAPSGGCG